MKKYTVYFVFRGKEMKKSLLAGSKRNAVVLVKSALSGSEQNKIALKKKGIRVIRIEEQVLSKKTFGKNVLDFICKIWKKLWE